MSSAVPVVEASIIGAIKDKNIPCGDVSHSELVDKCSHTNKVLIFSPTKGTGFFVHADCESINLKRRIGFSASLVTQLQTLISVLEENMNTFERKLYRKMEKLVARSGGESASRKPESAPRSPPGVLTPSVGTIEKSSHQPSSAPRLTPVSCCVGFGPPDLSMDDFLSGAQPTSVAPPHTTERIGGYDPKFRVKVAQEARQKYSKAQEVDKKTDKKSPAINPYDLLTQPDARVAFRASADTFKDKDFGQGPPVVLRLNDTIHIDNLPDDQAIIALKDKPRLREAFQGNLCSDLSHRRGAPNHVAVWDCARENLCLVFNVVTKSGFLAHEGSVRIRKGPTNSSFSLDADQVQEVEAAMAKMSKDHKNDKSNAAQQRGSNRAKELGDSLSQPTTTLFVSNLPLSTEAPAVAKAFENFLGGFGTVKRVSLPTDIGACSKSKGFGYVELFTLDEAKAARAWVQGAMIDGHPIHVEYSKPLPEWSIEDAAREKAAEEVKKLNKVGPPKSKVDGAAVEEAAETLMKLAIKKDGEGVEVAQKTEKPGTSNPIVFRKKTSSLIPKPHSGQVIPTPLSKGHERLMEMGRVAREACAKKTEREHYKMHSKSTSTGTKSWAECLAALDDKPRFVASKGHQSPLDIPPFSKTQLGSVSASGKDKSKQDDEDRKVDAEAKTEAGRMMDTMVTTDDKPVTNDSSSKDKAVKANELAKKIEEAGWEAVDFEEAADSEYVFL